MPVTRGFVTKIEIGRAGLVTAWLMQENLATASFVIRDLDGDPERFNERLSKLGILRDAMNRAEPVEVEFAQGDGGQELDRVARITRDQLSPNTTLTSFRGLVLGVLVATTNSTATAAAAQEAGDSAQIQILTTDLQSPTLVLDLQIPERGVALEQLRMLREAASAGRMARLVATGSASATKEPRIVSVQLEDGDLADEKSQGAVEVSGFVESMSLIAPPGTGLGPLGSLADVRFTTAPPFTGSGNVIANAAFNPELLSFFVPRNSLTYALFEAGLRDNLRMRIRMLKVERKPQDPNTGADGRPNAGPAPNPTPGSSVPIPATPRATMAAASPNAAPAIAFVTAAELLAPLASASRPVWVHVARESLDKGPETVCSEGVPSSDLAVRTLRELGLPFGAVWQGLGCFNHGVYRFQFELTSPFVLKVDGKVLCLHKSDTSGVQFAYACLDDAHQVTVELAAWSCEQQFKMDVYRVR